MEFFDEEDNTATSRSLIWWMGFKTTDKNINQKRYPSEPFAANQKCIMHELGEMRARESAKADWVKRVAVLGLRVLDIFMYIYRESFMLFVWSWCESVWFR